MFKIGKTTALITDTPMVETCEHKLILRQCAFYI